MSAKKELQEAVERTRYLLDTYLETLDSITDNQVTENVRQAFLSDKEGFENIAQGLLQANTFLNLCAEFGGDEFNVMEFGPSEDDRMLN